jgi:alkylation response protein AidB-like acyl-CoA dehydrogenase
MTLHLTDEQFMLKQSAEAFVLSEYAFEKWRLADANAAEQRWRAYCGLGWLALRVPGESGGLNGSMADLLVLGEALGRAMLLEPFVSTAVTAVGILRNCDAPIARTLLQGIAGGERRVAVAYCEEGARYRRDAVATTGQPTDQGYVLDGEKISVVGLGACDTLIVSAALHEKIALFAVEAASAGVTIRKFGAVDGSVAGNMTLRGVTVGSDALLSSDGAAALDAGLDAAVAFSVAEAVGVAKAALSATVQHLKDRRQFGQPLARLQVLQHRAADMFAACERSNSALLWLRHILDDVDASERARAVSAARAVVARSVRHVTQQAIQLHGGMGITDELVIGHYLKKLTAIEMTDGDTPWHLDRVAAARSTNATKTGS